MTLQLTRRQSESVKALLQSGAYRDEVQVIDEALGLLTKREELRGCVNAGVRQLDKGQYRTYRPDERDRFVRDIETASQKLRDEDPEDSA